MEVNEILTRQLREKETELTELFADYMQLVSQDAEMRASGGRPLFDAAAEEASADSLLKSTDAFLRPYMEEYLGTVNSLARAFRSEIADSADD